MPVISVTWEAEAGESFEPRRKRLQRAMFILLHFSLGDKRETSSQKKKKILPGVRGNCPVEGWGSGQRVL